MIKIARLYIKKQQHVINLFFILYPCQRGKKKEDFFDKLTNPLKNSPVKK